MKDSIITVVAAIQRHNVALAMLFGTLLGMLLMYAYYKQFVYIEVTEELYKQMRFGHSVRYSSKFGSLHVSSSIPACRPI